MKKLFKTGLISGLALMLFTVSPAVGQNTDDSNAATTTAAADDDDDNPDYGWIGLLGLAGLLGLRRNKDHDNRTHVNR